MTHIDSVVFDLANIPDFSDMTTYSAQRDASGHLGVLDCCGLQQPPKKEAGYFDTAQRDALNGGGIFISLTAAVELLQKYGR